MSDDRMVYADGPCPNCRSQKCSCLPCPKCGVQTPAVWMRKSPRGWKAVMCVACEYEADMAAAEEYLASTADRRSLCPHGRDWAECDPCMVAGDLAYDAAREGRMFR